MTLGAPPEAQAAEELPAKGRDAGQRLRSDLGAVQTPWWQLPLIKCLLTVSQARCHRLRTQRM